MADFFGKINYVQKLSGTIEKAQIIYEKNYELLDKKPKINGEELVGDKSFEDLGLIFDGVTIAEIDRKISVVQNGHRHTILNIDGLDEELNKFSEKITEHTSDKNNPHSVTADQLGLGNVENKSSADIRMELTEEDVINALGFLPSNKDTVYELPAATTEILGGVKLDGETITVDENGVISAVRGGNTDISDIIKDVSLSGRTLTVTKGDGTSKNYTTQDNNTTYGLATASASGLMSNSDKTKLDGLSTNTATSSTNGLMSSTDKSRLDNLYLQLSYKLLSGYVSFNRNYGSSSYNITFKSPFQNITGLTITSVRDEKQNSSEGSMEFSCVDVSNSGFTISVYNPNSIHHIGCYWIAVGT